VGIKNNVARRLLAKPRVKAGTSDAASCAAKAKPHIIAATSISSGEIYFLKDKTTSAVSFRHDNNDPSTALSQIQG
jgi:hypothetical protein